MNDTPWYVPPELASAIERSLSSGMFAFGVTMLYLLRKTPLPDLLGHWWRITEVGNDKVDKGRMQTWLDRVSKLRDGLTRKGLELIVKQKLHDDPRHRISAKGLAWAVRDQGK